MKSFKRCVLKNNKSRYNDRTSLIKRVLSSEEDYTTEKKVTIKGEEQRIHGLCENFKQLGMAEQKENEGEETEARRPR